MDILTLLDFFLLVFGIIILFTEIFCTIKIYKNDFLQHLHLNNRVNKNIKEINNKTEIKKIKANQLKTNRTYRLPGIRKLRKTKIKQILFEYCVKITESLEQLYPEIEFNVKIKKISDNYVYTVMTNHNSRPIDTSKQLLSENTEYSAILFEDNRYFFVTDLDLFDKIEQKYNSSDKLWRDKYNTSIVFPIKTSKNGKNKIIGFICIESPQTLKQKRNNEFIIKLIESTTKNLANILLKL